MNTSAERFSVLMENPMASEGQWITVHLLVTLKSTHRLADFMRELKKGSTLWMQASGDSPKFGWQDGYCALTVSPSARPAVRKYIAGQEEHHRKKTFREELVELLRKAEVSYEEKFLD